MSQGIVAIREFARRKGVSDTAIRKHIKAGHLKESVITLANGRPALVLDIAEREWAAWGGGTHAVNYEGSARSNRQPTPALTGQPTFAGGAAASAPGDMATLAAAKKAQAVYVAKIKELEYKEKLGKLVDRDRVYSELFAAGQEMRTALLAVPDKIIDHILVASDRREAHTLLYNAIAEALEKLVDIYSRQIAT